MSSSYLPLLLLHNNYSLPLVFSILEQSARIVKYFSNTQAEKYYKKTLILEHFQIYQSLLNIIKCFFLPLPIGGKSFYSSFTSNIFPFTSAGFLYKSKASCAWLIGNFLNTNAGSNFSCPVAK